MQTIRRRKKCGSREDYRLRATSGGGGEGGGTPSFNDRFRDREKVAARPNCAIEHAGVASEVFAIAQRLPGWVWMAQVLPRVDTVVGVARVKGWESSGSLCMNYRCGVL